ncbi:branched-chain amino acid ABC transporter substrate-binding protein [Bradyrhizobium canariense]|uniref:ABC transporter substrate-binding protein n=1 Tax=Bradyrhizobium canariense TaxID=255045 RepID=UPI000A18BD7B|nr:ABC transporter substrate-binding protein [Bradyrhizobium canariense]OSI74978.1 branched-chain amino acid ABC transporter substrate-binding protein [Bradyrhizobium canariense]
MSIVTRRLSAFSTAIILLAATGDSAVAQKKYDIGATDDEIKIGNIMPYSGPASAYGVIGKTEAAYFNKINAEGGINGRKIRFISYDDAYSPPKTVEQARRLVERDEVLLIFDPLGTASNSAIQKYMNEKKVPQLFVATGATKWNDPKQFPWTMGWQPSYQSEGRIYAKYILKERPTGKIGILYQNDDYGKDYVKGIRDGLGAKAASMIVGEESYETTTPTIDSHVVALKSEGVDIFISITTPKFAAQSIKKVAELGWKPLFILNSVGTSTGTVMRPAGFENAQNIISAAYNKDPTDPQWKDDAGIKNFDAFLTKYFPEGNREDLFLMTGYNVAQTMVHVLKQCGDDLTRANIMKKAASIKSLQLEGLLPGVTINTSAIDFAPIKQFQLRKFKGERWELFGDIISSEVGE